MQFRQMFAVVVIGWLVTMGGSAEAQPRLRPDAWAHSIVGAQLRNWFQVDKLLYRSAQPDTEGMAEVAAMGVHTVINLREYHSDDGEAQGLDLTLVRIPMNAAKIRDEDVIHALRLIKEATAPVLVHCWHGSDRTGVVIAMYRLVFQGWTRAQAIDELVDGDYGYHAIYGNITAYLNAVDINSISKSVGVAEGVGGHLNQP